MASSRSLRGKINKGLVTYQACPYGSRNTEYIVGNVMCQHFSKILIVLMEALIERLLYQQELFSNPLFFFFPFTQCPWNGEVQVYLLLPNRCMSKKDVNHILNSEELRKIKVL